MRNVLNSLWAFAIVLVCGCATTPSGHSGFVPGAPSAGSALVYLYRPLGETGGYNRSYFVGVNGRKVVDLEHGTYHTIEVNPGAVTFLSDLNRSLGSLAPLIGSTIAPQPTTAILEMKLEAGATYYVRMHPEVTFTHIAPQLDLISPEAAIPDVIKCHRLVARW